MMKIISPFKDYYDYALAWQIDEDNGLCYERQERFETEKNIDSLLLKSLNRLSPEPSLMYYDLYIWDLSLIFFCGELHIFMRYYEEISKYAYNNDIWEVLENAKKKSKKSIKIEEKETFRQIKNYIVNIFDVQHQTYEHIYQQCYTPLFVIDRFGLRINPPLINYKFQHIKDAYETYQQISQFLFGRLVAPEKPMIEVPDILKIESHGFDKKISFRKRKKE